MLCKIEFQTEVEESTVYTYMRKIANWIWKVGLLLALLGCVDREGFDEFHPLHVDFIHVGQGNAILLCSVGDCWMVDAGPDSMGIADTLERRGILRLSNLIITHNHRDHCGGVSEILQKIAVEHVWTSAAETAPCVVPWSHEAGTLRRGSSLADIASWHVRVLWPLEGDRREGNPASIVLLIGNRNASVLFVGDLEADQETQLIPMEPSLRVSLYQVGHHGSKSSSQLHWLGHLSPQIAVISVGKNNDYGHPHTEVLERLQVVLPEGKSLLRTDVNGSVHCTLYHETGVICE